MHRILSFFIKYNGVFAFLILEIIALSFYFSRNITPEKQTFISSANEFVGRVYNSTSRISRYWNLSAVNDSLARENADLKMQLPNSKFSSYVNAVAVEDTTLKQHYSYIEAKVVNNTIHRPHNYLTLNRGRRQGLVPNSGVLNANGRGVIGIAQKVSENYTVVMSILNLDARISAKIARNNYFGVMEWDGQDSRHMKLESVPKHADVMKGDTIVTSGFSTIFPEGQLIGVIDTFAKLPGSNFYTITVELFNDINQAQYVYVVNNLFKGERIKLEEEVYND